MRQGWSPFYRDHYVEVEPGDTLEDIVAKALALDATFWKEWDHDPENDLVIIVLLPGQAEPRPVQPRHLGRVISKMAQA